MSSGHIVAIKLRPYLKDFFINRCGETEPVKATITNKLFPYLVQYLTPKPKNWKPPVSAPDILLIELPYNNYINSRTLNYINPRNYTAIKSYFYGLFYARFIDYMNDRVLLKKWQVKYAIMNFIDENNISYNNANYDSLKRIFYRYRFPESEKKKEKSKNILTTFRADSDHIRHQFSDLNETI